MAVILVLGGLPVSTFTVPVDIDAVEERILAQFSLRELLAALAALVAALLVVHALSWAPLPLRVAAAAVVAAAAWLVPTARLGGATPVAWASRLAVYVLSPRRILPESAAWQGVIA